METIMLTNQTGEELFLCVLDGTEWREWPLPVNGNLNLNASQINVVMLQSEPGNCPGA